MCLGDRERRVLAAHLENGRATAAELAAVADLAEDTVSDVRRALEDRGVVTGYRPRLAYDRLGFDLTAVLEVVAAGCERATVRDRLASLPHVLSCYEVTGTADVFAIARYRSPTRLDAETRALASHPAIESLSVHVVLETLIEGRHPPLAPDR